MRFLDSLWTAIDNYITARCKTAIVNFSITGGGGTKLDVGETFQFKVELTNNGPLDMRAVTIQANATQYADVALASGTYGSRAVTTPFNLDAGATHITGYFRGKAKKATGGAKDIVTAQVAAWDASLDHILRDHSVPGVPQGKLNAEIYVD